MAQWSKVQSSNQKDPGSIPGEAFYLFFLKKRIFSSTFKRFCGFARKNAKLRPIKIIQKNLKLMPGVEETHGLWRPLDVDFT